jgi:predicted DNA-binding WGR domain protein
MPTFEFHGDKSAKFWSIDLRGKSFTVRFGKISTTGQTQTKEFADEAKAKKEYDKLVAEKAKKGYVETASSTVPPGQEPCCTSAPLSDDGFR